MTLEATLLGRDPKPPLFPSAPWREDLAAVIDAADLPPLARAGLHLWNDDIERCHKIAQEHETPDGNYWHAILHRREKDFSNALYWYQRVGPHPVLGRMAARYPDWSAAKFVRWCESGDEAPRWLEVMQAAEMEELLRVR